MNELYGPSFLLQERSSGYKSSAYAIAEIIDNSVDAGATSIDIFFEDSFVGQTRTTTNISRIIICDNGMGMDEQKLNGCLRFAEGSGRSDGRIGAYGVGLPKSSISVAKRVDVFSRQSNQSWRHVFLDLDEQLRRASPGYDLAVEEQPEVSNLILDKYNTVVIWSELDRIDFKQGKTLIDKYEKLLGRIYRYPLKNGLKICFHLLQPSTMGSHIVESRTARVYDPMFLTKGYTYTSDFIWDAVERPKYGYKHGILGDKSEFNSTTYYQKYNTGYQEKRLGADEIFQLHEDFDQYKIELNNKTYSFNLKVSYAPKDITNPGLRNGGDTILGRHIGEKMEGSQNFKSGNIFFMRTGREIDFGNFGFYKSSDPKNRFWTIEVHFDSDLDFLMGLANNKQSVQFNYTSQSALTSRAPGEALGIGEQREHLWALMSDKISKAIETVRKLHTSYARQFKELETSFLGVSGAGTGGRMPTIEPAVIEVMPTGEPWTDVQITEFAEFLKTRYRHLSLEEIRAQVESFSAGHTKSLVLYAPTETGELFELIEKRSQRLTLINSRHPYYEKIIQPLKNHNQLKVFAVAIEMLISSMSVEMDRLRRENPTLYSSSLSTFIESTSTRLREFIENSHLAINTEKFLEELGTEDEDLDFI